MDCKQRIRDIIEIRLHNLGLRQKDLADSIGVPVSTLNSWAAPGAGHSCAVHHRDRGLSAMLADVPADGGRDRTD